MSKVILFGGRLSEAKGGGLAIEALALVVKKEPSVVLVVVGKVDGYAEVMKVKAKELGILKHIRFIGWIERDRMDEIYDMANVILVPSICLDVFPRTVLESMARSKPVVATCYGGSKEIVLHGKTGYIVNPFNIKKTANYLIDLLSNPQKAAKFGKAGYEHVARNFNLQGMIHKYVNVYEQIIWEHDHRSDWQVVKDWLRLRWLDLLISPVYLFGLFVRVKKDKV